MPSSNFNGSLVLDVLRYARIPPQVLQVELHPYLTQDALVQLVKCHGIALTAYSSFGPQVRQPEHLVPQLLNLCPELCPVKHGQERKEPSRIRCYPEYRSKARQKCVGRI